MELEEFNKELEKGSIELNQLFIELIGKQISISNMIDILVEKGYDLKSILAGILIYNTLLRDD